MVYSHQENEGPKVDRKPDNASSTIAKASDNKVPDNLSFESVQSEPYVPNVPSNVIGIGQYIECEVVSHNMQ
jgi:hypothetical protein